MARAPRVDSAPTPSSQEGARKMALVLWVFSLLGSACLVSANIFGEFEAQGREDREDAIRPGASVSARLCPRTLTYVCSPLIPRNAQRWVICSFLFR
jgi:hypothetical protein